MTRSLLIGATLLTTAFVAGVPQPTAAFRGGGFAAGGFHGGGAWGAGGAGGFRAGGVDAWHAGGVGGAWGGTWHAGWLARRWCLWRGLPRSSGGAPQPLPVRPLARRRLAMRWALSLPLFRPDALTRPWRERIIMSATAPGSSPTMAIMAFITALSRRCDNAVAASDPPDNHGSIRPAA
jgi:hypothetical protein